MRRTAVFLALGLCSCGKEADPAAQPTQAPAAAAVKPMAAQSKVSGQMASKKPAMLAVPADKQQLDRLLAMCYTVHDDHLHPPGVKECPFDMGGSVVQ